jgi:Nuclease-related domain/UvrD-like helicase C-terminal domain/AAA domain
MARMLPEIDPASIENSGERAAYKALRDQLPSAWVVRYHYPFCWKDGNRLKDGEADFIVVAPKRGLMVVEVKGSHGFDCENGRWTRIKADGSREAAGNPFEQAAAVKHRLVQRIAKKVFQTGKERFPCCYGHLVMYPNGRVEGGLPSSVEPLLMIAYKDMDRVAERFEGGFDDWKGTPCAHELSHEDAQRIVDFLSDNTLGIPVLAASSDEDDERIEQLTQNQFRSFQGLLRGNRVHVSGPAGSGKTLLAQWTAQLLAERGERILLTCYNRVLAEWLRGFQAGAQFEIRSFFSLCRNIVMKAGLPFSPPNNSRDTREFWKQTAPILFDEAITKLTPDNLELYDGIIVDEAQDFHPDWWVPLMLMLKDPDRGRLCIFSDDDQRGLYGQGLSYPASLFPYDLQDNCRNTRKIATYCGKLIGKSVEVMPLLPEGSAPNVETAYEDPQKRARAVKEAYGQLIDQGFQSNRIAILSPLKVGNRQCSLTYIPRMFSLPLRGGKGSLSDWKEGRCIWACTIKAFKGLEADCVILTDCSAEDSTSLDLAEIYVGTTRAKHKLIIVPSSSEAKRIFEGFL